MHAVQCPDPKHRWTVDLSPTDAFIRDRHSVRLPLRLSLRLSVRCPFVALSRCLTVHLSACLCLLLSHCLFGCPALYLFALITLPLPMATVCLFVRLSCFVCHSHALAALKQVNASWLSLHAHHEQHAAEWKACKGRSWEEGGSITSQAKAGAQHPYPHAHTHRWGWWRCWRWWRWLWCALWMIPAPAPAADIVSGVGSVNEEWWTSQAHCRTHTHILTHTHTDRELAQLDEPGHISQRRELANIFSHLSRESQMGSLYDLHLLPLEAAVATAAAAWT